MYKYHIVYKTTNIVNNKIYVGVHSTNNLNDGYKGSGKILKQAILKYGEDKFNTTILYYFNSREEAEKMEALIVNEEFINRTDTYNLVIGGKSGLTANQFGSNNIMFGKIPITAKNVKATNKEGTIIIANSIEELSSIIHIARGNIRNLIKKNIIGKKGWRIKLI